MEFVIVHVFGRVVHVPLLQEITSRQQPVKYSTVQYSTVAVCPHGNSMFEGEGEQLLNVLFIYFASHGTSLFRLFLFFRSTSTLW
jgi:hypothetical protein